MEDIAAKIDNPYSLVAFVVAGVLTVVFVRTEQRERLRWFALTLALIAVAGGLYLAGQPTSVEKAGASVGGSVTTTGDVSPVVNNTGGNVTVNSGEPAKK